LKAEHAGHVQHAVKKAQQRAEGLMHLASQEHDRALSEYQDVWELTKIVCNRPGKNWKSTGQGDQRGGPDRSPARTEEMIQRLAEQTAARLGLEDRWRRAHERIDELKNHGDQPAQVDPKLIEEIRRQAVSEHEQNGTKPRFSGSIGSCK